MAYFDKMKKGIVLNKSKGKFLAGLAKSQKLDDWVGLTINIRDGLTTFAGDEVACIRFERTAATKRVEVENETDDELPEF